MNELLLAAPIAMPTSAERVYLKKFQLGALAVLAGRSGAPVSIVATADLMDGLSSARRAWPREDSPILAAALWAHCVRDAQRVATLVLGNDLRVVGRAEGRLCVDVPVAVAAIERAAVRLGVRLVAHQDVLARARAGAAAMSIQVAAAQANGSLRGFNLRYRNARIQAEKENRSFLTYNEARRRLEAQLALSAATGAAIDFAKIFEGTRADPKRQWRKRTRSPSKMSTKGVYS
jgi:hypothetical protein